MASVWLAQAFRAGSFVALFGLLVGCALETSAIGLPDAGDIVASEPVERPTPRRDASTAHASSTDDAHTPTPVQKPDLRPNDAGDLGAADPGSDAGATGKSDLDGDGGGGTTSPGGDAGVALPTPFPAIDDPWQAGPYTPSSMSGASRSTVFAPVELGSGGRLHPIVIWDNTAGITGPSGYQGMLQHLASHGFVVVAAESSSVEGAEVLAALAWISAENTRPGSTYFGMLDTSKVAAAGHGLGSIATFAAASDPRLSTTVHLSGATNKAIGSGHGAIDQLAHPAAFFCDAGGGNIFRTGDAEAGCQADFDQAQVPVFFATVSGPDQLNLPVGVAGALVSWLRWQLLGDAAHEPMFAGPTCTLCSRTNWSVQSKGL